MSKKKKCTNSAIPKREKDKKNSFSHTVFARAVWSGSQEAQGLKSRVLDQVIQSDMACLDGLAIHFFLYIMAPNPFHSRKKDCF